MKILHDRQVVFYSLCGRKDINREEISRKNLPVEALEDLLAEAYAEIHHLNLKAAARPEYSAADVALAKESAAGSARVVISEKDTQIENQAVIINSLRARLAQYEGP